jgi:hypothetical protein
MNVIICLVYCSGTRQNFIAFVTYYLVHMNTYVAEVPQDVIFKQTEQASLSVYKDPNGIEGSTKLATC